MMNKKHTFIIVIIILTSFGIAIPAAAITYGEPDGNAHPYVGVVAFYDDMGDYIWHCSGTLIAPTVFLTAGHCTFGAYSACVWFDPDLTALETPYPTGEYPCSEGTPIPHDQYDDSWSEFPNSYDVGVVILNEPVDMDEYGELPELGYLDELSTKRGHQDRIFRTVGYGLQSVRPRYQMDVVRYTSTSMLVNLRSKLTDGYNLHTSNNPGRGMGTGGSCLGDSGGPIFHPANSNQVVGIVSFGQNNICKGADFSYRMDIPDAQEFINGFLP
jgi:hypothetical protein